jgi:hypothetical protein
MPVASLAGELLVVGHGARADVGRHGEQRPAPEQLRPVALLATFSAVTDFGDGEALLA